MRIPLTLLASVAPVFLAACGDDPKGQANPVLPAIDAAEARLIGLHEQALVLRSRGQYAEALKLLEELSTLKPDDLRVRFNRAVVLAELQRPAEALAIYDELSRLTPNDPQVYQNRATVLNDLGRSEEALIDVGKAMRGQPDSPVLRVLRAAIPAKLGRPQEALAELDAADQLIGRMSADYRRSQVAVEARFFRGDAFEALGRPAEAAQVFDQLRAEFPGDANVERLLSERGKL